MTPFPMGSADPTATPEPLDAAMERNDAIRVLALACASQGYPDVNAASLLRDIEEGGYTLRLTTAAERREKNDRGMSR